MNKIFGPKGVHNKRSCLYSDIRLKPLDTRYPTWSLTASTCSSTACTPSKITGNIFGVKPSLPTWGAVSQNPNISAYDHGGKPTPWKNVNRKDHPENTPLPQRGISSSVSSNHHLMEVSTPDFNQPNVQNPWSYLPDPSCTPWTLAIGWLLQWSLRIGNFYRLQMRHNSRASQIWIGVGQYKLY